MAVMGLIQSGIIQQICRIGNSFTRDTQAQGQDSNPDPESPQATGPGDQGTACPCFPGVKPLQAETKNDGPNGEASQNKGIIAPNGGVIKTPNGGNKILTISFMNLKSTPMANQEPSPERGMGPQPNPMATNLEQDNQVANLISLTNERTPGLVAILPPLNLSTQILQACLFQCLDEPPKENIKSGSGVLYRPKDPVLQTYCHF
ncbi:hypothetical protein DSO57_1011699 [Entomophthora muscae]|uniref:Uncharacterized protein n=1 Tax=Entomophthora muscae TaxID=34485 RepID=A0ACC2SJK2_9FUNG|nr:hypothetical protein DSO57_1011699 [Entomophthora muscae]